MLSAVPPIRPIAPVKILKPSWAKPSLDNFFAFFNLFAVLIIGS